MPEMHQEMPRTSLAGRGAELEGPIAPHRQKTEVGFIGAEEAGNANRPWGD